MDGPAEPPGLDCTLNGLATTDYRPPPSTSESEPALVFLHSLGLSKRTWVQPCRILGQRHRCLAVDIPGHGGSAPPAHFMTVPDMADAVAGALRAEHIREAIIVGNSMGATVAVAMAIAHPDLVIRVALVGAAVWEAEQDRRAWLHSRSTLFFAPDGSMNELGPDFVIQVFGEYDAARHQLMVDDQRRAAGSIASAVWALYSYDIAGALAQVRQPVLAIFGGGDPYHGLSMPVIRKHTTDLTETVVEGGSHLLPVDKAAELALRLEQWIAPGN